MIIISLQPEEYRFKCLRSLCGNKYWEARYPTCQHAAGLCPSRSVRHRVSRAAECSPLQRQWYD